jgi:hypothetical protein
MPKTYIRIEPDYTIVGYYSTDFEQPKEGDICINENGERHPKLNVIGLNGYKLKWDAIEKKIKLKTENEIKSNQKYIDMVSIEKRDLLINLKMKIMAGKELGINMVEEEKELEKLLQ